MLDYDPPFDLEFTADADYWDKVYLPWNDEDEDLNIDLLLNSTNDF